VKTILHPDYWIEIPAGEFLIGLSEVQRDLIGARIREQMLYEEFSASQRRRLESIVARFRQRAESGDPLQPVKLSSDEERLFRLDPFRKIFDVEYMLMCTPAQTPVWLDCFYIARFPITKRQYGLFCKGTPATNLPGALEQPLTEPVAREAAPIPEGGLEEELCQELGGRLPDGHEWEKAARGTEGRLYPWGNEWDPEAGYFFYGQAAPWGKRVDAFPRGVSPYGVWAIVGGLPELVTMGGGEGGWAAMLGSPPQQWPGLIILWG
jgi:sulfatase modifying factor 1